MQESQVTGACIEHPQVQNSPPIWKHDMAPHDRYAPMQHSPWICEHSPAQPTNQIWLQNCLCDHNGNKKTTCKITKTHTVKPSLQRLNLGVKLYQKAWNLTHCWIPDMHLKDRESKSPDSKFMGGTARVKKMTIDWFPVIERTFLMGL